MFLLLAMSLDWAGEQILLFHKREQHQDIEHKNIDGYPCFPYYAELNSEQSS